MAAVPDNENFSLQDVIDAISGSQTSLSECFSEADSGSFDATYGSISDDDMLAFRNYDEGGAGVLQPISLSFDASSGSNACAISPDTTYYIPLADTFLTTDVIYTDSGGTTEAPDGHYSNSSSSRYWFGGNFISTSLC